MTATMPERSPDLGSQWQDRKESMLDTIRKTIECRPDETIADASYRVGINIPLEHTILPSST